MQAWQGKSGRRPARAMAALRLIGFAATLFAGGCGVSVQTPLPDLKPVGSTALSPEEKKKAVDELNQIKATHEQDAIKQIEQSR